MVGVQGWPDIAGRAGVVAGQSAANGDRGHVLALDRLQQLLAGRLQLREQLGPDGKLARAGLIDFEGWGERRVQDFWSSGLYLADAAFDRIVGISPEEDGKCPCCGKGAAAPNP